MKKTTIKTVIALIVLFVTVIAAAVPAYAADDYPANLKNARKDALVDPWRFYNRECTSFVAWCLNSRNGVEFDNWYKGVKWGNASHWRAAAQSVGIPVDTKPAVGAVAWLSGHVAWVAAVEGDNVTVEEYNRTYKDGKYNCRTVPSSTFTAYIHIKDLAAPANAKVSTDKAGYTLGAPVTVTASGDGMRFFTVRVVKNGRTVYTNYDENESPLSFTPTEAGTYKVYCSVCASWKLYETVTCTFTVDDPVPVHFVRAAAYDGRFTDVGSDRWYAESVADAYEFGLMKGTSPTRFSPDGSVTLAEAITVAARIHSIYKTGTQNFAQSGRWYEVYLDYAYENGIIDSEVYSGSVTRKATRAQCAEIFAKALPDPALYPIKDVPDGSIPDVPMDDDFAPAVYKLYRAGVLRGSDSNGRFKPNENITRAEFATIVSRMAESDERI